MKIVSSCIAILTAFIFLSSAYTGYKDDEIEDAVSQLNDTIDTLQDTLDELESYQPFDDEDDLWAAQQTIKETRAVMRSEAIALLLASVEHQKKGDWDRVQRALKILAPEIFKKEK